METKIPTFPRENPSVNLEAHLIQLLLQCNSLTQREVNRRLETFDLKLPQFLALNEIVWNGPLYQKELCRALDLEKSNISKIVQLLFRKNLIKITPGPVDRRATLLSETPAGQTLWKTVGGVFNHCGAALSHALTEPETRQLTGLLKKLQESLHTTKDSGHDPI